MKKMVIATLVLATVSFADMQNQLQNQKQDSKSTKESSQRQNNKSETKSDTKSQGEEKSISNTLSRTLTGTKSATQTIQQTETGTWSIIINPVSYVLEQMQIMGWNSKAFFLNNRDIGTSYSLDTEDEIIDLNKKAYMESKAAQGGRMSREQIAKISQIINLLVNTSNVAAKAIQMMQGYQNLNVINLEEAARSSLLSASKVTKSTREMVQSCNFGMNMNIVTCDSGKYTLQLTGNIPTLMKYGVPVYSATQIGHMTPSITVSFAQSNSDAMSLLAQDSESKVVAQLVKDYTNHQRSLGRTDTAAQIESAFIEKALTENISQSVTATRQAINTGNPIAVLRVFQ